APAPASADVHPATVVERRVSPRGIVDPRIAVAREPRPVAEAIRRPFGIHGWEPHGAVLRIALPLAIAIEVRCADHLARHVIVRARRFVDPVAFGTPRVEA